MKTYRIATIPGRRHRQGSRARRRSGAARRWPQRSGRFRFEFTDFGWGGDWYRAHGVMMPADGLDALRGMDAILFGSAGDPHIPDHVTLWGLRLKICQGFDQYANVRPTRILPGIDAPLKRCAPERPRLGDRARELRGRIRRRRRPRAPGPSDRGRDRRVDDDARRRRAHHALRLPARAVAAAQAADRGHQVERAAPRDGDVGRDRACRSAREFPDVRWDKELVDACTARMVNRPASLDTMVATNLHADILSDLAAALAGSLGIAPTGNIDPERRYPSMFEPIHGSAFDIMGKGLANPIGTFWSCVMLLEHLGEARGRARADGGDRERSPPTRRCTRATSAARRRPRQVTAAVCARMPGQPCGARRGLTAASTTSPRRSVDAMKRCCWRPGIGAAARRLAQAQACPDKNVMYWQAFPPGGEIGPVGAPPAGGAEEEVPGDRHRSSSTRPAPAAG